MAGTETVVITTKLGAGGADRQGANQLALLAPLGAGASVAANVVKKYRRVSDAEADHGVGSQLALGVKAALGSGIPFAFTVGVAQKAGSPFTETFGAGSAVQSGTLTAANLPLTEILSVTRDGTAIPAASISYTHLDPTTQTVAAGKFLVNPKTGKWKGGDLTTGAGAGYVIQYQSHDWTAALAKLDLDKYEVHAPAGFPFNAQNYGVYDALLTHAVEENKIIAAALDSGAKPADVSALVGAVRSGRLYLLAAHSGDDVTSAFAAKVAKTPVNGTLKEQKAPEGVSYTDSYLRADFDDEENPATGSFHQMGVNAVFKDRAGTFRISNDRAATGLTDAERFGSYRRSVRRCEVEVEDRLLEVRRRSTDAIPFTEVGLGIIRNTIASALGFLRDEGIIDTALIAMPQLADISDGDRANRVVPGIDVSVRLTGQVHLVKLDLNVDV